MTTKELALKLFAKVYGLRTATVYLVKKTFPKFRASIREHWEMLILKLLGRDKKANKVPPWNNIKSDAERVQEIQRMNLKQLQDAALAKGLNPYRPRFILLRDLLSFYPNTVTVSNAPINRISGSRRHSVRQWDGRL